MNSNDIIPKSVSKKAYTSLLDRSWPGHSKGICKLLFIFDNIKNIDKYFIQIIAAKNTGKTGIISLLT